MNQFALYEECCNSLTTGVYVPYAAFYDRSVGSLTSHKTQISENAVRRGLQVLVLI